MSSTVLLSPPSSRSAHLHVNRAKPARPRHRVLAASPALPALTLPQSLACGAIGRLAQILTMYPVDTIKTRIQVARTPASPLASALAQGALYRGVGFSLLGQIPYAMLTFGLYESLRTQLAARFPRLPEWARIVVAAAAGDALGSLWLTPSEVVKSKTQAGLYPSPVSAARATAAQGARSFYQGYPAAIARDIPFRAIQLSLYERFRSWYVSTRAAGGRALAPWENLLIGALSGTLTGAFTTPLDVVRTRMMSQAGGAQPLYKNALDCVVKTVSKEGPGALLKGLGPRCVLIGPSSAVFFFAYEASKGFFRGRARGGDRVSAVRFAKRRLVRG